MVTSKLLVQLYYSSVKNCKLEPSWLFESVICSNLEIVRKEISIMKGVKYFFGHLLYKKGCKLPSTEALSI